MTDRSKKPVAYVLIFNDVTEDRKLRRRLNFDATHDSLTGLSNRLSFEQDFESLVADGDSTTKEHVIVYLDLDQFKIINDTCGHPAGDLLLKQLSDMLRDCIRQTDTLARLGGDEFGILFPYCKLNKATEVVTTIIQAVVAYRFIWNDKVFSLGMSAGVTPFSSDIESFDTLLSTVDSACYLAKESGGNKYHVCVEDDIELLKHKGAMNWVSRINCGLQENRFLLYVQPIKALSRLEEQQHYEALIRYQDEEGELILPGAFLPSAERYNLNERIDRWVISETINWLEENRAKAGNIRFSINLSGRSLGSVDFLQFIEEKISASNIDPQAICFEITETAIISDVARSIEFISAIKKLGARFALDDFGSGLSSFAYLKHFSVDYLKIDGMFVKDIIENPESYVFVRAMTEVGHCLGMKVIAEYVESTKMHHILREANVDYIQGWSVGKPFPLNQLFAEPCSNLKLVGR